MSLNVAKYYRGAVVVSIIVQVGLTLLMASILDGGRVARVGACAMIGFWLGVALIMARRPRAPRRMDLLYVRWGYVAMLAAGIAFAWYRGFL